MCLAMPAKVIELRENGEKAVVEQLGSSREVFNNVVNAKKGDFVLLQQGFIVERLSEKEARKAMALLR